MDLSTAMSSCAAQLLIAVLKSKKFTEEGGELAHPSFGGGQGGWQAGRQKSGRVASCAMQVEKSVVGS